VCRDPWKKRNKKKRKRGGRQFSLVGMAGGLGNEEGAAMQRGYDRRTKQGWSCDQGGHTDLKIASPVPHQGIPKSGVWERGLEHGTAQQLLPSNILTK